MLPTLWGCGPFSSVSRHLTRWLGASTFRASLCQEVVLISEEYGSSGPTTGGMSDFGAQKEEPGTGVRPQLLTRARRFQLRFCR